VIDTILETNETRWKV